MKYEYNRLTHFMRHSRGKELQMYTMYTQFTESLLGLFTRLLPMYIGQNHHRMGTKVKPDSTPVTSLDHYMLERLRGLIAEHFPDDYTIGEEDGKNEEEMRRILGRKDQYQWTIDGLDGTWHYIRRTNSYGAMVSRRFGNNILYAAIFRPVDMALRGNGFFCAERGRWAWEWCQEHGWYHRLQTASHGELERVTVLLEGSSKKFFKSPLSRLGETETTRPSLSSCIAATTVARGDATAVVTVDNKPWDNWPIVLFVEEAGGIVTDHRGKPYSVENCGSIVAAANPEDHARIIRLLDG